jgi:hypothetical protein
VPHPGDQGWPRIFFGREAEGVLAEGVDLGDVDGLDQIAACGELSV